MIRRSSALTFVLFASLLAAQTRAADFYVAPTGNDSNPGTLNKPFASLAKAQQAARTAAKPVTVYLRDGIYYLPETLVFTDADSGSKDAPVVYRAYESEKPVLSGGVKLDLKWEPCKNGIMQAKVPAGLETDQLFINGDRQVLARYPNFNANQNIFNGYARDAFSKERAARWANPTGGFMHAMHTHMWGGMHYRITGKNDKGELTYEGGWQNNRASAPHKEYRMVENIFEELDAPGEWFLNSKTNTLYYYPTPGLELANTTVEAIRLRHLIEFRGSEQKPVKFISFHGLTFRNTTRTFMDNKEPLVRSDWTTYRGGALFFTGAEDCTVEDCLLDQLGGNAIFVNNYNRRITVRGCHIVKAGANGVAFVGDPAAAKNSVDNYDKRNDYSKIDKTPGPKTNNYPADCLVDNCLIHETGRVEKQTAPVQIELAQSITVRHCSIYDVPRAGINIGDGCWGGHLVEYCDVFNTVLETGDHGSFNSWGRDRFWMLKGAPDSELPQLALLDVVKPITLRNSRWRCDHGWDIDLDDGSSNYEIYNNLLLHGGLKLREGFHRKAYNNITVGNTLHPHVWYPNSGDIVKNNIFMTAYAPVMRGNISKWGKEIDHNFFAAADSARTKYAKHGCDANSLSGDAMFINPAEGDYRVKDNSPALKVGFKNFPMDQFGVQKPDLKAIAKTPSFTTGKESASKRDGKTRDWLGIQVKNIVGEGEMSAYGTPGETGVLVISIPAGHSFAKAGLKKDDVIQKVDGRQTDSVGDLLRNSKPKTLHVLRNQQSIEIKL